MIRHIGLCFLGLILCSPAARASSGIGPECSLALIVRELPVLGSAGTIQVLTGAASGRHGRLTMHVPLGLTVLDGDTERTVHFSEDSSEDTWTVRVRVDRAGRHRMVGSLTVGDSSRRVELDSELILNARADTTFIESARPVRAELVDGGQRYRYDGTFIIPISKSEQVTPQDIVEQPKPTRTPAGQCRKCRERPVKLPFLVYLDEKGKVTSARPLPLEEGQEVIVPDSALVAAARRALDQWRFSPARTKSHPTVGWLAVKVEVRP